MPSTPDSSPSGASRPLPRGPAFIAVAASVVLGIALWSWRGHVPGRGSTLEATVSLVTTDRDNLACASAQALGPYRCGLRAPGSPWPTPPARADLLAAYYTVNQQLLVIPGLFEQPALAARYAAERARGLPRDSAAPLRRDLPVRAPRRAAPLPDPLAAHRRLEPQDEAWVAVPSNCRVR